MGGKAEWRDPSERPKATPHLQELGYAVLYYGNSQLRYGDWPPSAKREEWPFYVYWWRPPTWPAPTCEELSDWASFGWTYYPAQGYDNLKTNGAFDHSTMSDYAYCIYEFDSASSESSSDDDL